MQRVKIILQIIYFFLLACIEKRFNLLSENKPSVPTRMTFFLAMSVHLYADIITCHLLRNKLR